MFEIALPPLLASRRLGLGKRLYSPSQEMYRTQCRYVKLQAAVHPPLHGRSVQVVQRRNIVQRGRSVAMHRKRMHCKFTIYRVYFQSPYICHIFFSKICANCTNAQIASHFNGPNRETVPCSAAPPKACTERHTDTQYSLFNGMYRDTEQSFPQEVKKESKSFKWDRQKASTVLQTGCTNRRYQTNGTCITVAGWLRSGALLVGMCAVSCSTFQFPPVF